MLDFQKLDVYQLSRSANKEVLRILRNNNSIYPRLRDQLSRAALSVMLNIAEGAGRFTKADKQHYYIQARASAFETVACLEACLDLNEIGKMDFECLMKIFENISKMLFGLINKL